MTDNWCSEIEQGAVLLTVNQRLSRHYTRSYSDAQLAAGKQWWETPQILPLSAWLKQMHASAVVNGESKKTLLADIASERAWQQIVSQDEAASVLLDTDLAASNALKAWRTANAWRLAGTTDDDGSASEDQRAFSRWRAAYKKHCKKNELIDANTISDHVVDILVRYADTSEANASSVDGAAIPKVILLAGFLVIPAQLQRLLDTLTKQGTTIRHIKPSLKAKAARIAYADDDAAFELIAHQVRATIEQDPNQRVGVVVHDLQQKRGQVLRAFDTVFFPTQNPIEINTIGRPYDLSIGLPLNEQSVVRSALLFLKLLTSGLNNTELSALLISPYLPGTPRDIRSRQKLDRRCRDKRIRHVGFFEFIALLDTSDSLREPLQSVAKRKWKNQSGAAVWAEHFGAALRTLGWPGKSIDSEEYQTVEAWNACLDDFLILDDGEAMSKGRALRLLTRLCRSRVFQLETLATPVQIMGRLESHGLSFDKLWVTGLDSDQWPPVSVPTSFLPIQQQQAAGVPDAAPALRLAHAEAEVAMWKQSANTLYVCHAQARDGLDLSPAPIIADVPLASNELQEQPSVDVAGTIKHSAQLQHVEDVLGPELEAGTKVRGGTRLLENQARCPFKAFALHRLGIKKLEEAGIGLDPRQHGTLFHHCMELFWEQVKTHANLVSMSQEELHETYGAVIEASMKAHEIPAKLQSIQSRYLHRLMSEWVNEIEITRQPFSVVALEKELDIEIAGVGISVMVDRIDKLATGQTVVIDYKTGQNNAIKTWGEPRIENPQLPLYVGTDEAVEGVCFAQVYPNNHKLIGTTVENDLVGRLKAPQEHSALKHTLNSWDEAKEHWNTSLNMLATEIRQGVASITPVKAACDYCELSSLCRINKSRVDSDDEAGAHGVGEGVEMSVRIEMGAHHE